MRRFLSLAAVFCMLLVFATGCSGQTADPEGNKKTGKTNLFDLNTPLMVGVWQMDTYVTDEGETYHFWDNQVFFVYNEDGTGSKTVGDTVEYTMTYSYNGKNLYTTAVYPDSGQSHFRNDLCTVTEDTVTIYSYDEMATITLKRVDPTSVTIPTLADAE